VDAIGLPPILDRARPQLRLARIDGTGSPCDIVPSLVDPDDESFLRPHDMLGAIDKFCTRTHQPVPQEPGVYVRAVLESLAFKYRSVLRSLEQVSGKHIGQICIIGTLMPPIFRGVFASEVLGTHSGLIILGGVVVCLLGIAFAGAAGVSKEREMSTEQKRASIKEFDLKKGLLVATFSGVMSACFAYGLAAGDPIKAITIQHGTPVLWQGLPVLVVVLAGGITTNFIWCLILNIRNRTGYQYFESEIRGKVPGRDEEHILEAVTDAPGEEMAVAVPVAQGSVVRAPMLATYLFSALAGTTWYMQSFFYTMGETQMGRYKFSSWTLHRASIIIFSTLWGIALKEWKGAGVRTRALVGFSLLVLVSSTVIVGYGNYVGRSSH